MNNSDVLKIKIDGINFDFGDVNPFSTVWYLSIYFETMNFGCSVSIFGRYIVNLKIFTRVLFLRNFAAKFREN